MLWLDQCERGVATKVTGQCVKESPELDNLRFCCSQYDAFKLILPEATPLLVLKVCFTFNTPLVLVLLYVMCHVILSTVCHVPLYWQTLVLVQWLLQALIILWKCEDSFFKLKKAKEMSLVSTSGMVREWGLFHPHLRWVCWEQLLDPVGHGWTVWKALWPVDFPGLDSAHVLESVLGNEEAGEYTMSCVAAAAGWHPYKSLPALRIGFVTSTGKLRHFVTRLRSRSRHHVTIQGRVPSRCLVLPCSVVNRR